MVFLSFILALATTLIIASILDALWIGAKEMIRKKRRRDNIMARHYQRVALEESEKQAA